MFCAQDRALLRDQLVTAASTDPMVCAAALLGSATRNAEDAWSDIDLALRLKPGLDPALVAAEWTGRLRRDHQVVDHFDLWSDGALYRVFLLGSTLQLDLSFWPYESFRATGPAFRLLFGDSAAQGAASAPKDLHDYIGMAWLHALHARSAIARGRVWQAVWMLEGMRNQIVALACERHGLIPNQGRGVDLLPAEIREALAATLVASTGGHELRTIFRALTDLLLREAEFVPGAHRPELPATLDRLLDSLPR